MNIEIEMDELPKAIKGDCEETPLIAATATSKYRRWVAIIGVVLLVGIAASLVVFLAVPILLLQLKINEVNRLQAELEEAHRSNDNLTARLN